MKVLSIAHDFLPASTAGVEVFVHDLSRALVARGVDAVVAHTVRGVGLAQYALRPGRIDGVRTWQMVQNYPYRPLDQSIDDPQAERCFDELLTREAPDVVHIHHLARWSIGLPRRAQVAGIPVLMHLHDHWLACPSGGQRFHPDGRVCEAPERAPCDACHARYSALEGPLEQWGLRLAQALPRPLPPDLLHRTFASLPGAARTALKRLNRRPEATPRRPQAGVAARRRDQVRRSLAAVDRLVSPSRDLAQRLDAVGVQPAQVRFVANGTGLDTELLAPLPGLAYPRRPLSLLFLGTPAAHKGVHVLVEAVRRVDGPVRLAIHGADPSPAYRDRMAPPHDRVRLAGPLPHRDVAAAIDRADVVCLPSLWLENAPLVLLEARARGRPVLASDIGGVSESAHGMLLPPGDVDAWSAAIHQLATDRAALGALAEQVEAPRTMRRVAAEIHTLYRELG